MCYFQTLAVLLFSLLFVNISYGQTKDPTVEPTQNPTEICDRDLCQTYVADNATWLLPNNEGCKDEVDGYKICKGCPNNNFECECTSEQFDAGCAFAASLADALATWIIILIVIGSLCGLCIIISIIYCICAGALCCAAMSK